MKVYTVLLAILYALRMFISLWALTTLPHWLFALNHLADIALFTLCVAAAVEFGFGKRLVRLPLDTWRLVGRLTLVLGAFSTLLYTNGQIFGAPAPAAGGGILQVAMIFLPYVLFAIPVIVYEHKLRQGESPQE
jgi:hypothetical protein